MGLPTANGVWKTGTPPAHFTITSGLCAKRPVRFRTQRMLPPRNRKLSKFRSGRRCDRIRIITDADCDILHSDFNRMRIVKVQFLFLRCCIMLPNAILQNYLIKCGDEFVGTDDYLPFTSVFGLYPQAAIAEEKYLYSNRMVQ